MLEYYMLFTPCMSDAITSSNLGILLQNLKCSSPVLMLVILLLHVAVAISGQALVARSLCALTAPPILVNYKIFDVVNG